MDDLFQLKSRYGVPMLSQFAELVNREMFWVVTEVCSEHNLVRRSKIIKQFIKIARKCLFKIFFFSYLFFIITLSSILQRFRHVSANRSMQRVQELQLYVRDRVRPGSWRGLEIESIVGEITN